MGEKIVIGPINSGQRNDRTAFVIDNDSFPNLINAYQWRGRVKRKRGTKLLGRLKRFFNSTSVSYNSGSTSITLDATGFGNILSGFNLELGNIVPGTVSITSLFSGIVYTDPSTNGTLNPSGSIVYSSGQIIILAEANNAVTVTFQYYPSLPVMGIEDLILGINDFPGNLAFDTTYSYNLTSNSASIYDVSFYKNPSISASLPSYVPKTNPTPTSWNGQDYQQFWTVNYQGALWATNGITVPFISTHIGMQFKQISNIHVEDPQTVVLNITAHNLVVGDFLFINEVPPAITGINFQTGYVIDVVDANDVRVKFPDAIIAGPDTGGGIAQYLTNRSDTTKDCLRFYDGNPTNGSATNPLLTGSNGWVNFCPPLSQFAYSISDLPLAIYYLVGARMIIPFKDRLLFIGVVIQTSSGLPIYLSDTIIYSQNGTPYYTSSFEYEPTATSTDPTFPTIIQTPILVPNNQTSFVAAFFEDQTGFGGFVQSGVDQPINTVSQNEDVLILGFKNQQSRFVYSGNDLLPFAFYTINSEYGSGSTFSAISLDKGVITTGNRGYIITGQTECKRIDLDIPDKVFQTPLTNNATERITAQRDYINEWIYFSFPSNTNNYKFPTQTLQYNYRDDSWGLFNESYTTYGTYRANTGLTWASVGKTYPTWKEWNNPWNSGSSTILQPQVLGGNAQGFIMARITGTGEGTSLEIMNISFTSTITNIVIGAGPAFNPIITSNNTFVAGQRVKITAVVGMTELNGNTYTIVTATPTTFTISVNGNGFTPYVSGGMAIPFTIYSPNHCLNNGDFILITGALGTISSLVNNKIFQVSQATANEFNIALGSPGTGTYLGNGSITRLYRPFIQTKQFPLSWSLGRKTRLGTQKYLLTTTDTAQITLLIYLSQDGDNGYNEDPIIPEPNAPNQSCIYSTILYTCTESSNLGLTPANTNLQMISNINSQGTYASSPQQQIWHRMNTSLIGDTVQMGFTLSDIQMKDITLTNQFSEIELHGIIIDVSPSSMLS